jgi:hypothetical protein
MEAELTAIVSARLFSLVDSYTPWSVCFSHVTLVGNTKEREKKMVVVVAAAVVQRVHRESLSPPACSCVCSQSTT